MLHCLSQSDARLQVILKKRKLSTILFIEEKFLTVQLKKIKQNQCISQLISKFPLNTGLQSGEQNLQNLLWPPGFILSQS